MIKHTNKNLHLHQQETKVCCRYVARINQDSFENGEKCLILKNETSRCSKEQQFLNVVLFFAQVEENNNLNRVLKQVPYFGLFIVALESQCCTEQLGGAPMQ